MNRGVEVAEHDTEVAGLGVHWLSAGDRPLLYVHGDPTASFDWLPFLERIGGVAPDLPGFGRSAKPAEFDYSIAGYDRWLEAFTAQRRASSASRWWCTTGAAPRSPSPSAFRSESSGWCCSPASRCCPASAGTGWPARWRTPLVGEMLMGFTTGWSLKRALPAAIGEEAWRCFDHGTQRAILKLYRASPPEVLERAGRGLGELRCPALILWPTQGSLHRRGVRRPLRGGARRRGGARAGRTPATGAGTSGRSWSIESSRVLLGLASRAVLRAVRTPVPAPPGGPATRPPEAAPPPRRLHPPSPAPPRRWYHRVDWWKAAPVLISVAFALAYLIWQPRTVDMAAHTFRADLFGQEGFALWNGQWYGGHHTLAYSVLSPPLAWLFSPALVLAAAAVASAALFPPLMRGAFGDERARWGSIWFGAGTATLLFTGRLPFAIGVALGLAALLALQRRRYALAIVFAVLCPLGSPVAGLFLALAGLAFALAARRERDQVARGGGHRGRGVHPSGLLGLRLPRGRLGAVPGGGLRADHAARGDLPRPPAPRGGGAALGTGAVRAGRDPGAADRDADGRQRRAPGRALRRAGGAVRALGTALGPAAGDAGVPVVGFTALAVWQWAAAVRDVQKYVTDPAAKSDYFEPLRQWLYTLRDQRRIEIPFTRGHWEGAEIAPETAMARGGLRQLDTGLHPIFYREGLNSLTYASLARGQRGPLRGAALGSARPQLLRRAGADREGAAGTCACAGSRTTGGCTSFCCPHRS